MSIASPSFVAKQIPARNIIIVSPRSMQTLTNCFGSWHRHDVKSSDSIVKYRTDVEIWFFARLTIFAGIILDSLNFLWLRRIIITKRWHLLHLLLRSLRKTVLLSRSRHLCWNIISAWRQTSEWCYFIMCSCSAKRKSFKQFDSFRARLFCKASCRKLNLLMSSSQPSFQLFLY